MVNNKKKSWSKEFFCIVSIDTMEAPVGRGAILHNQVMQMQVSFSFMFYLCFIQQKTQAPVHYFLNRSFEKYRIIDVQCYVKKRGLLAQQALRRPTFLCKNDMVTVGQSFDNTHNYLPLQQQFTMPQAIGRGMARFPPPSETSSIYDDRESEPPMAPLRRPGQVAPTQQEFVGQREPIQEETIVNSVPKQPIVRPQADLFLSGKF